MLLLNLIIYFVIFASFCDATIYDRYTGQVASEEVLAAFERDGVKSTCTMKVAPCDATERRRVDGSCNNMNHPVKGTYFEPLIRVLPAQYFNGSHSRKSADGSDLELPRVIRNTLLWEGKSSSMEFTQAVPAYGIFTFGDIGSVHDTLFFLQNKTNCCNEEGMNDDLCGPNIISENDPVHRFSGIRCMNLTKPLTYADFKCTNDTEPSPIQKATGVFDLSLIYNIANEGDIAVRSFQGGMLAVDVDKDGIVWPPNGNNYCGANQPGETRCFGNYHNVLMSVMLLTTWYIRNHNYFATQLAAVNPCWDDETLFQIARDMNIAFSVQVYYYEWLPAMIGFENLVKMGILSKDPGHRDIYDFSKYPIVSLEFTFILRWFHTAQEGMVNMYYPDSSFMKAYPFVNTTFRPGFLGLDKNIVHLTQHFFRQATAAFDCGVDPDLSEMGLPYVQETVDVPTSDLHKSRLLGFPPYIDYLYYCTGHNITSFEDLDRHMELERIELIKQVYKYPSDIDLMAGLWAEKIMERGKIPPTVSCLIAEYVKRAIETDRHWYERDNRPHAFTKAQLAEIRKSTLALLICNNADEVTHVQPHAFLNINSVSNPLTACEDFPNIDFAAWTDNTCV